MPAAAYQSERAYEAGEPYQTPSPKAYEAGVAYQSGGGYEGDVNTAPSGNATYEGMGAYEGDGTYHKSTSAPHLDLGGTIDSTTDVASSLLLRAALEAPIVSTPDIYMLLGVDRPLGGAITSDAVWASDLGIVHYATLEGAIAGEAIITADLTRLGMKNLEAAVNVLGEMRIDLTRLTTFGAVDFDGWGGLAWTPDIGVRTGSGTVEVVQVEDLNA